MGNKVKVKVKVNAKKSKPIKPKMGRGTGGLFTARIIADVRNRNKENGKNDKA